MARTKVDLMVRLKDYVESLQKTFPGVTEFNRKQIDQIGKTNMTGQLAFGSKQGFGHLTKIGFGKYVIPDSWILNPPWKNHNVSLVSTTETEASATKKPSKKDAQAPKTTKTSKAKETEQIAVEEVQSPVLTEPTKKKLTKKELFEIAKQEIAKKKAKKEEVIVEAAAV